ncbi:hypothetical protein SD960_19690 [Flavobacterium sp. MMLR14_040]|uniref:hypothetical protein n=1 Tax=Flavobacterium sp. MMLR14_040 TaxID=3093843 RepID=UPI0029903960|nr:hypothetical protein [Flavobacterium sp. MMLR14_040]MDW8852333.1 hypothetical protein [Flavobacterium sp. MMLR14_040]
MIKKIVLLSLIVPQLTVSCSSDDSPETIKDPVTEEPVKDKTLAEEIAEILKQPYSNLTPAEQKVKLEAEANEILVQLEKTKNSGAIGAMENLNRLLDVDFVDIFNGQNNNQVEDILNVSGVYGIYSWNNAQKKWLKTDSATELKFVFPAKASQTENNASFSAKSVSSDIKVKIEDSYRYWIYDEQTQQGAFIPAVNDHIFLPTSTDAILTIDNAQAATFTQTASYSNGKEAPDDFTYKMILNDGYTWEMSGKKGIESTSKGLLTYNGKTILDFNAGSNANIDVLIENDTLVQYRGKANGLMNLMDNFIIIADMDLAAEAAENATLKSIASPLFPDQYDANTNFKAYYTARNKYEKILSENKAANFNKNMKLILVSKKDGTKIADLVKHSEKSGDDYVFNLPVWNATNNYWEYSSNGESFSQPYLNEVLYLKFSDNTEVEFSAYFSTLYDKFQTQFGDFIKSFGKK